MNTNAEKTYVVDGMTCGSCELSVRDEIEELTGVESVLADRVTGHVIVRGDVDDAAVRAAVKTAGYRVAEWRPGPHDETIGDRS